MKKLSEKTNYRVQFSCTIKLFKDPIPFKILCFPLLILFITIAAKTYEQGTELKWSTGSEVKNCHYEVERSINGGFGKIGKVFASSNLLIRSDYSFTHPGYNAVDRLYCLKQVDRDGNYSYSSTLVIKGNKSAFFNVIHKEGNSNLIVERPANL